MANTVCHEGYCESPLTRGNNSKISLGDMAVIGGIVLTMIAFSAVLWYGTAAGFYPTPLM